MIPNGMRMRTNDRYIFENIILKNIYLNKFIQDILFVGIHPYSAWYNLLILGKKFQTVDPNRQSYAKNHITGKIQGLEGESLYDCIILNGVFGYGTDTPSDKLEVIETSHKLLRKNGVLLLSYNDSVDLDMFNKFEQINIPGHDIKMVKSTNGPIYIAFKK